MPHLQRMASDDSNMDAISNKNVNWIGPKFFLFYAGMMVACDWLVRLFLVDTTRILNSAQGFTLVHACHGVVNFVVMHYFAGTPGELQDQGEYLKLTWWEQLDDGTQWTFARKMLIIIPIVLFLFTSHLTEYEPAYLALNLAVLALVLIPKLPQFHRVRLVSVDEE